MTPPHTPDRPETPRGESAPSAQLRAEHYAHRVGAAEAAIALAARHLIADQPSAAEDVLRRYLRDADPAALERILKAEGVSHV